MADPQQQQEQNGADGSETEADMEVVEVPKLDRKGETSQRTMMQKHKQEELVKRDQRAKGQRHKPQS